MSLYKDASLVMIPSAYKDGKLYSIRPIPEYGAEEVTNGDFNSDLSGWTINNANAGNVVEWSAGQAHLKRTASAATELKQSTLVVGKNYYVNFYVNIIGDSIGGALEYNGSTRFVFSQGINSFKFTSTSVLFSFICLSNTTEYYIDNVSVKEVLVSDGNFTFSRGTNLSATRVDASQLIEKGRENLLLQSNQFDTTWTPASQGAIAGGQAGYDGSSDAWLLTAGAEYSRVQQSVSQSGVNTFSVYAKSGTEGGIFLRLNGGSNPRCFFDLNNGQVGNPAGDNIDASIESVGNGWYRCSLITNNNADGAQIYIANDNNGFVTSGNIYIQDAQLEVGLAATEYIESGATTAQAGILENTPRFDYSGGATCPSLLLEPSRSNRAEQSEYFDTYWDKVFSTITLNNDTPFQNGNSYTLTCDGTTGTFKGLKRSWINVSANTYSLSVFAKSGTSNTFIVSSRATLVSNNIYASFNLSNGTINSVDGGTALIEPYSNGWYRCTFVAVNPGSYTDYASMFFGHPHNAANGSSVLVTGAQSEIGSYPTSYIPTYGVSQTRAQDVCSNAGDSSTFNDSEGVLFVEFSALSDTRDNEFRFLISDGSNGQRIQIGLQTNNNLYANSIVGGGAQAVISDTLPNPSSNHKIAFKYKANDFALYVDGVKVGTDISGTTPTGLDRFDFYRVANNNNYVEGNVKQTIYFPTALTDSECIALTTI